MDRIAAGLPKFLCLAAIALTLGATAPDPSKMIGKPAPEAEFTLIDGTKLKLSDMRGKVVVLNFWATWCVPCREELPTLDRYFQMRQANGLRVIAITTESSLPLYRLKPLFEKMHIPSARRVKGPYEPINGGVPSNYVIDRAGNIRYAKAGAFDLDELNQVLVPLLNEPAPE